MSWSQRWVLGTHVHPLHTNIRVSLWRDDYVDYVHVARPSMSCLGACTSSFFGVEAQRIVRNRKKKAGIYSIVGRTTKKSTQNRKMLMCVFCTILRNAKMTKT